MLSRLCGPPTGYRSAQCLQTIDFFRRDLALWLHMCFSLQPQACLAVFGILLRLTPKLFSGPVDTNDLVIPSRRRGRQLEPRPAVFKDNVDLRGIEVTLASPWTYAWLCVRARRPDTSPWTPVGAKPYVFLDLEASERYARHH